MHKACVANVHRKGYWGQVGIGGNEFWIQDQLQEDRPSMSRYLGSEHFEYHLERGDKLGVEQQIVGCFVEDSIVVG